MLLESGRANDRLGAGWNFHTSRRTRRWLALALVILAIAWATNTWLTSRLSGTTWRYVGTEPAGQLVISLQNGKYSKWNGIAGDCTSDPVRYQEIYDGIVIQGLERPFLDLSCGQPENLAHLQFPDLDPTQPLLIRFRLEGDHLYLLGGPHGDTTYPFIRVGG